MSDTDPTPMRAIDSPLKESRGGGFERTRQQIVTLCGIALCLFTVVEMNFPRLQPQSALALFVMLGLVVCFLEFPANKKLKDHVALRAVDIAMATIVIVSCGYVIIQTEPWFEPLWQNGLSLGNRAGAETHSDFVIGLIGLVLVFEATRRSIGWIVPLLALFFVGHTYYCYASIAYDWAEMPDWLLPHAGQEVRGIVSTTFLQTLGVFGPAAGVMFKYVFLFVVFGSFLEMSGATQFIIDFSERMFGRSPGGPAKVSVLGSGLMGSLSGSAVANAVTTGTFTIPMMRNAGFQPHVAGGVTAAAAAGGALVPPVMGAGAYMMLEIVEPQVTFLQVARAAAIPAILYYLSIWLFVHFYSRRLGTATLTQQDTPKRPLSLFEAAVFFGALGALIGLLILSFSPFRAVTGALVVILLFSTMRQELKVGTAPRIMALTIFGLILAGNLLRLQIGGVLRATNLFESALESSIMAMVGLLVFGLIHPAWRPSFGKAMAKSARNGVSLVAASACVGIIIGIVQETGIATDFSTVIKGVVQTNLALALVGIMGCSIVLGMGVPSVVCYLLMATLMGSLLGELGVIPLAAHLFIFYFGMMSMVTPPVALAGYAAASIAQANIMRTSLAAFSFSLVGFSLPFMFVYRPALLLMDQSKWNAWMDAQETGEGNAAELLRIAQDSYAPLADLAIAVGTAVIGVVALSAAIAGYLGKRSTVLERCVLIIAAACLLFPSSSASGVWINVTGGGLFALCVALNVYVIPRLTQAGR